MIGNLQFKNKRIQICALAQGFALVIQFLAFNDSAYLFNLESYLWQNRSNIR